MTAGPARVLARIDDELRALWSTPANPGEPLKSRACTMNLVVVAPSAEAAARWVPIVDEVVQGVPARAIVAGLEPGSSDALEASVSAVCTPDAGHGTVVCSERVTLVARGAIAARLPSCVDAICAADVPMTLVWLVPADTEDAGFVALAGQASRIVLDAAQTRLSSLARVVRWSRRRVKVERPGIADLAWTRLASWQELCARVFDPPPVRALARRVTSVAIVQASSQDAGVSAEAALLVGWLATRLGWTVANGTSPLRADGVPVPLQVVKRRGERWAPGAVLEVALEASDANTRVRSRIARESGADSDMTTWRVEVASGGETRMFEHRLRLWADDAPHVLERTLHRRLDDDALCDSALWADAMGSLSAASRNE